MSMRDILWLFGPGSTTEWIPFNVPESASARELIEESSLVLKLIFFFFFLYWPHTSATDSEAVHVPAKDPKPRNWPVPESSPTTLSIPEPVPAASSKERKSRSAEWEWWIPKGREEGQDYWTGVDRGRACSHFPKLYSPQESFLSI